MIGEKSVLAIIPARSGSKRLPRKNLASLAGKPLIAWSIESAIASSHIDEVMVSTDDTEIASISRENGANVPFIRPAELATDTTATADVIEHAIRFYEKQLRKVFDVIVLLQPTSPLRNSKHIDSALKFFYLKKACAVVSVCETEHSPLWTNILPDNLSMSGFLRRDIINRRSQDIDTYYRLNGAIYICKTDHFLEHHTFFIPDNIFAYIMPPEVSVDVDNIIDLKLCEFLLTNFP